MKLKTLKDLDHPILDQMGKEAYTKTGLVDINELKAEAVKWVKKINFRIKALEKEPECKRELDYERGMRDGLIKFHNITEEDLK